MTDRSMRHCDYKGCNNEISLDPADVVFYTYAEQAPPEVKWYTVTQYHNPGELHFCSALHLTAFMLTTQRVSSDLLARLLDDLDNANQ